MYSLLQAREHEQMPRKVHGESRAILQCSRSSTVSSLSLSFPFACSQPFVCPDHGDLVLNADPVVRGAQGTHVAARVSKAGPSSHCCGGLDKAARIHLGDEMRPAKNGAVSSESGLGEKWGRTLARGRRRSAFSSTAAKGASATEQCYSLSATLFAPMAIPRRRRKPAAFRSRKNKSHRQSSARTHAHAHTRRCQVTMATRASATSGLV